MSVIAIIGAGPGMGLSIAKTFGNQGFKVALMSRNLNKLKILVNGLLELGIEADAFQVDVSNLSSITSALAKVKLRFGQIDVLEFSPSDSGLQIAPASNLSHENVQVWLDFYVHGAIEAVNAVLPDMLAKGKGSILFTTGAGSIYPQLSAGIFANAALAMAALRNYAHGLHAIVGPKGVQVGHVAIGAFIGKQPGATPEAISPLYWDLHTQRDQFEMTFMPEANDEQDKYSN